MLQRHHITTETKLGMSLCHTDYANKQHALSSVTTAATTAAEAELITSVLSQYNKPTALSITTKLH